MTIANQNRFRVPCQCSIAATTRFCNQTLKSEATRYDFLSCQIV